MNDQSTVTLEWVCNESTAKAMVERVGNEGGKVMGTTPFVPKPEEADLYSDAQFDPLVIVGVVVVSGMVLRYVRELILDLKGREVAIIDLSSETPQIRVVPLGKASQVIVKEPNGSISRFTPSDINKIEQRLTEMLPQVSIGGSTP